MKTVRIKSTIPIIALLLITNNSIGQTTRTIIDMGGRKVIVPKIIKKVFVDKHCAMMINAIAPEKAINIVFDPSVEAKVFLATSYYQGKPYVQGTEEILKIHPDVVFMSDELSPSVVEKAEKLQKQVKIPVVLLEMDMNGYKKNLTFLGN